MRVTIDLMKKSTQIIDLSNVINPRVGDDDLLLPLHIVYGDNQTDMRGKDVEFLSNDPNKKNIYIAGTCNTNTPGDNLYMGDLTFRFPAGTFQADGTYDPDKTMFRIVDKETQKVISSVNVKITVMKNNIEFDFDPDNSSYDSRLETMLHDFHDKGQAMLDEIKDLNNQAASNVSGDTATTANEAKKQADQNAGDISDLKGEVAGARGRFADMAGREDAQDAAINQKESIANANANYTELKLKDAQQDAVLAQKAGKFELEDKLAQMNLQPEMYADLNAVNAAYPNGATKLIATDDGYLALYRNGQWIKGPVFQAVGLTEDQNNRIMDIYQEGVSLTQDTISTAPESMGVTLGKHWLFIQASNEAVREKASQLGYPSITEDEQGIFTYSRSKDVKTLAQSWETGSHIYARVFFNNSWSPWYCYYPEDSRQRTAMLNVGEEYSSNLIVNGNCADGVKPAVAHNADTVLNVSYFMGRSWLEVTSTTSTSGRGPEWGITDGNQIIQLRSRPAKFTCLIQSSVTQRLSLGITLYDGNGQINGSPISCGTVTCQAGELTSYSELISLSSYDLTNVVRVGISLTNQTTEDMGQVLITDVSLRLKPVEAKRLAGDFAISTPRQLGANSPVSQIVYNGKVWSQLILNSADSERGIAWRTENSDQIGLFFNKENVFKLRIFPLVTTTALLKLDFYDDNGNDLNKSVNLEWLYLKANQPIDYEKIINVDNSLSANVYTVQLSLVVTSASGELRFCDESLSTRYAEYGHKTDNLVNMPAETVNDISVMRNVEFLDGNWTRIDLFNNSTQTQGIAWGITGNDPINMLLGNSAHLKMELYASADQVVAIMAHYYDTQGNVIHSQLLDTVYLIAGQVLTYRHNLDLDNFTGVAKIDISAEMTSQSDSWLLAKKPQVVVYFDSSKTADNTDTLDLPAVYLSGLINGMSKDNAVPMKFKFVDRTRTIDGFASVKWQGDSSVSYPKKPYRIKTFVDGNLTQKLSFKPKADWNAGNKWNLKAYYTDALLCRDVVNAKIGGDVWATEKGLAPNLLNTNNFGFVDGFPIRLYINNQFTGIYSFNITKGDYGDKVKAAVGSVGAGPTQFFSLSDSVKLDGQTDFEMITPDDSTNEIKTSLNNVIKFIATSSDDDFKANLSKYLDIESTIDYFIFCNLIEDTDAWIKNQTMFTLDMTKWYFHPYDLDMSLGSGADGSTFDNSQGLIGIKTNNLFKRLSNSFNNEIKARYQELRSWLTPAYVINKYRSHIDLIGMGGYEADRSAWHNQDVATAGFTVLKNHIYHRFRELDKLWLK